MNIKSSEKKAKSMVELTINVEPAELDSAIDNAYRKNRSRISVPGFRKGKATRKMIERLYGADVFHTDALDILLPELISFALKESDMKLVSYPQVTDVDFKHEDGGVDITIEAAVYPEVTLGEYKGVAAPKPDVEVLDDEVDKEVAAVRLRNARIEKADRPAINGDIAVIDYEGFVDGEAFEGGKGADYELELGSGTFIPGFEEKIQGMVVGEERDVELVFPENYTEHLAGKDVVFKVKLNEIKEKQLPDLDDEFAKDVSEFDTLDEYKSDIRARFLKAKQNDADVLFENALMEKIAETVESDIPDAMVEEQMDNAMQSFSRQISAYGMDPATYLQMMNTTPDAFRENSRVSSEKQVKIILALEKIAELEGVEVSDEDIENEYKEAAVRYGTDIEKLKESIGEERIIGDIKLRRAAKIVTDNAIVDNSLLNDGDSVDEKKPNKTAAKKTTSKKPSAKKTEDAPEPGAEAITENEPELSDNTGTDAGTKKKVTRTKQSKAPDTGNESEEL